MEVLYTTARGDGDAGRRLAWRGREGQRWTYGVGGEQHRILLKPTESWTTDKAEGGWRRGTVLRLRERRACSW
eukprot:405480-Rhodomonas_salina.1